MLSAKGELIKVLESISKKYRIEKIWAHQETGVMVTYKRDLKLARWSKKTRFSFEEFLQQGVFRGMKNRVNWLRKWDALMNETIEPTSQKGRVDYKKGIDQLQNHIPTVELEVNPIPPSNGRESICGEVSQFFFLTTGTGITKSTFPNRTYHEGVVAACPLIWPLGTYRCVKFYKKQNMSQ